jgi:hypothetical protein
MPPASRRPIRRAATAAVALLAAAAPALARANRGLETIPLEQLAARLDPSSRATLGPDGLRFDVDGPSRTILPFAAEELEMELQADGPILLIWAVQVGTQPTPWGRPWRYRTAPTAPTRVRVDLKTVAGWTPAARPAIGFDGSGHVLFRAIRARRPPADLDEARRAYDRARFWAPESPGPVLINAVSPVLWNESRGTWFADVVALAAAACAAGVLAAARWRTGRWSPPLALGAGAAVALLLWNGHFLFRFLPMANLRPTLDPEERIRANYYYLPEFAGLAALARATIGPGERVGVAGSPRGWFAPQTMCFNLAPRRCVILRPGEDVHHGVSGVGTLRTADVDVVVSYRGTELPAGFERVSGVGLRAFIARRR